MVTPVVLFWNGVIMAPADLFFFMTIQITTPAMTAKQTRAPTTAPAIVPPLQDKKYKQLQISVYHGTRNSAATARQKIGTTINSYPERTGTIAIDKCSDQITNRIQTCKNDQRYVICTKSDVISL